MSQKPSYCAALVRENDPDRFLLSMFAPAERREALWALFAFNHEIAKTREVVTETQLGLIRLQWWREAIGKVYDGGDVPEHQVLEALARAIREHGLAQAEFEALIYAREFDLEDKQPTHMEGLLNYADFTGTPLMRLAVQICGDDAAAEPYQQVAMNYGLAGLLRAVPFHARQRRCYLPEEVMEARGVKLKDLYALKPGDGLAQVVQAVHTEISGDVRPQNRFLKASQVLAGIHQKQLKNRGFNPFHPKMAVPPAFRELRLAVGTYWG